MFKGRELRGKEVEGNINKGWGKMKGIMGSVDEWVMVVKDSGSLRDNELRVITR